MEILEKAPIILHTFPQTNSCLKLGGLFALILQIHINLGQFPVDLEGRVFKFWSSEQ